MSASPIFSGAWPINWSGAVSATADTSLTAPSNFTTIGTVGADTKLVQPSGVQTIVTATFTVAAATSSQTITVVATGLFVVGDYVWVNDGVHALFGHVTVVNSSTSIDVTTDQINLGAAGNTMGKGAVVQRCAPIATDRAKIEQLRFTQIGTTSATGYINVFTYDGANWNLFDSLQFTALTLSSSVQQTPVDKYYNNLQLPTGWSLRITTTISGANWTVTALGGYT